VIAHAAPRPLDGTTAARDADAGCLVEQYATLRAG